MSRSGECGPARTTFASLTVERQEVALGPAASTLESTTVKKFDGQRHQLLGVPLEESAYAALVECHRVRLTAEELRQRVTAEYRRAVELGEVDSKDAAETAARMIDYYTGRTSTLNNHDGTYSFFEYRFIRWADRDEFDRLNEKAVKQDLDPIDPERPETAPVVGHETAWYDLSVRERHVICAACNLNASTEQYPEGRLLGQKLASMEEKSVRAFVRRALGLELLRHRQVDSPALSSRKNAEILGYLTGPARPVLAQILRGELCDNRDVQETVEEFGLKLWEPSIAPQDVDDCGYALTLAEFSGFFKLINRFENFKYLKEGSKVFQGGADLTAEQVKQLSVELEKAEGVLACSLAPGLTVLGAKLPSGERRILVKIPFSDDRTYGNFISGYGIKMIPGEQFFRISLVRPMAPGEVMPKVLAKTGRAAATNTDPAPENQIGNKWELEAIERRGEKLIGCCADGTEVEFPPIQHSSGKYETVLDAFSVLAPLNAIHEVRFEEASALDGVEHSLRGLQRVVALALKHNIGLHLN